VLTDCQPERKGQVRTLKECERVKDTYKLLTREGGTSQDTKTKQKSKGNSHAVNCRVRALRESKRASSTHFLLITEEGASQNIKRKQKSKGTHSLSAPREGQLRTLRKSKI
jgi:hypothetical protein